jgi:hypothetical protein
MWGEPPAAAAEAKGTAPISSMLFVVLFVVLVVVLVVVLSALVSLTPPS